MRDRAGFRPEDVDERLNDLAKAVVDAVAAVRTELRVGLLEEVYRLAMVEELKSRGLKVATRVPLLVSYKGKPLGKGYEADIVVEERLVIELKACQELHPVHEAQLLTYMHLLRAPLGFLVNFNAVPLGTGIKRKILSQFAYSRIRG